MDLPTARFVPDVALRAASRARRPTDLLVLLLRTAALLLLGLALAGPVLRPDRTPLRRIVLLDRSGAVGAPDSAERIARANLRDGDVLVTFDTVASTSTWTSGDSIGGVSQAPADLAAALLGGLREARAASERADSVELILVSPVDAAAWSPATLAIRNQWPGAIRVERVAGAAPDSASMGVVLRSEPDDPLGATLALLGNDRSAAAPVRLVRDAPTAADSAWARDSAGVVVHWPLMDSATTVSQANTGAVLASGVVAVAPWMRMGTPTGRAIAWWVDGEPAAGESPLGSGCIRDVAIGIPRAGDVALASSTQRLVRALIAPCGAPSALGPVADSLVRQLEGSGGTAPATRLVRAGVSVSPAAPWLLGAAILLLVAELVVRRRVGSP
jgi:hypothetical protein